MVQYQAGEKLSSREKMYAESSPQVPHVILGVPMKSNPRPKPELITLFTRYFGVAYGEVYGAQALRDRIDTTTLMHFGRFRLADDGDKVRTADQIIRNAGARDNSFIRYDLLPDANAAYRNRPDIPIRVTHYGQVQDICYVEFIENPQNNTRQAYLLVLVKECNTNGADAALPQSPVVKYNRLAPPNMIHIDTVNAVVGRIQLNRNTWGIIDRSRSGARTQFVDEDGDDFD